MNFTYNQYIGNITNGGHKDTSERVKMHIHKNYYIFGLRKSKGMLVEMLILKNDFILVLRKSIALLKDKEVEIQGVAVKWIAFRR